MLVAGCSSGKKDSILPPHESDSIPAQLSGTVEFEQTGSQTAQINVSNASIPGLPVTLIIILETPGDIYTMARESADSQFGRIDELTARIKEIYRNNRGYETSSMVRTLIEPMVR